jgi:signal transduction histidine kinase
MEDDAGIGRLLQKKLERAGYAVDLAADGGEGLDRYDEDRHDVLILDQQMPVHTGLDVIRHLARGGPLPPIIMITGAGSERTAVEAMKLGAGDYVIKDVDGRFLSLLPTIIERLLRQRRLQEEKEEAEQAIRRYAAELEVRNREIDAFAHTVAHDLKNPLHLITGYAYLLEEDYAPELDAVGRECLEAITQSVDKMAGIIDALLLLSSVRREEVRLKPVDMGPLISSALNRLRRPITTADAEITVPEEWPACRGYSPWIEEVWVNYISNAVKYGGRPADGVPPRIELGYEEDDGCVRFWVRDNGRGLTEEEQERLFREFTRLESASADGHGLGLSIVRRIVNKLGGEVGVESAEGRGSVFSFTLPAVPSNNPRGEEDAGN